MNSITNSICVIGVNKPKLIGVNKQVNFCEGATLPVVLKYIQYAYIKSAPLTSLKQSLFPKIDIHPSINQSISSSKRKTLEKQDIFLHVINIKC